MLLRLPLKLLVRFAVLLPTAHDVSTTTTGRTGGLCRKALVSKAVFNPTAYYYHTLPFALPCHATVVPDGGVSLRLTDISHHNLVPADSAFCLCCSALCSYYTPTHPPCILPVLLLPSVLPVPHLQLVQHYAHLSGWILPHMRAHLPLLLPGTWTTGLPSWRKLPCYMPAFVDWLVPCVLPTWPFPTTRSLWFFMRSLRSLRLRGHLPHLPLVPAAWRIPTYSAPATTCRAFSVDLR